MKEKLKNLLTVKSIVTIVLTGVFAYLAIIRAVSPEMFIAIFTVVIGFYFGTQSKKNEQKEELKEPEAEDSNVVE